MAARIKKDFQLDATLVEGDNGIFDVVVDGDMIYSKHDTGSFPTDDEIVESLGGR